MADSLFATLENLNITSQVLRSNAGSFDNLYDEEAISSYNSTAGDDVPQAPPGCFEGPEKTMEVFFAPDVGRSEGLRALTKAQLDFLCTKASCTILSTISSNYIDAYVLSESSMFVYKNRFIMKTCGTTTLLRCLGSLLEFADELGMELTWVGYSRKNLMFPSAQQWPHSNFGDEITYLNSHGKLQERLKGSGYILGPITGDHWFVYAADHTLAQQALQSPPNLSPIPSMERTINMMMFDMHPDVADLFYLKSGLTAKEMTLKSGISKLCPGAMIDESSFTPCGYSMNAILHDAYSTIHITPEPQCSYASFETNTSLKNYSAVVRNVLNTFRPKRFVLTFFGDDAAVESMQCLPTDTKRINLPGFGCYNRTSYSSSKVETELNCFMSCFSHEPISTKEIRESAQGRDRCYSLC